MSNTSLDLSNKLPAEQVNIIRQVVRAAESQGLRLFIVGAQARDLLLQYVYDLPVHRATNDIDFGIIVESWDEFTKLRDDLIADKNFQPHRTMRQRLVHESELLIDLIPFGDLEEVSGQISWPPDFSIVMSTAGLSCYRFLGVGSGLDSGEWQDTSGRMAALPSYLRPCCSYRRTTKTESARLGREH